MSDTTARIHEKLVEIADLVQQLAVPAPVTAPQNNRPKLTKREVAQIRAMKRNGHTQAELAEIYAVNPATISRIIRKQYHR
jgi:DNA invertase Pin-like site-specific DNA recombinase